MRLVMAVVGVGFVSAAGAAEPPAVVPAALPPPFVRPTDTAKSARFEAWKCDPDPIIRGLARGEIKAGDPVESLITKHRHYDVLRYDRYVTLQYTTGPFGGGVSLVAADGRLVFAVSADCIYHDVFFDRADHAALVKASDAAKRAGQRRTDFRAAAPGVVGGAAGTLTWPSALPRR